MGFRQNSRLCKGPGASVGESGPRRTHRSERKTGAGREASGAVCGRGTFSRVPPLGVPPGAGPADLRPAAW